MPTAQNFHGYYAALPTPYSADTTTIAVQSLADLTIRNLESGLTGLYVGGSTGEAFLLSLDERKLVLKSVAEAGIGRGVLIAHVGDPNPEVSAELARTAAEAGYDAVSAVPPFYYKYGLYEITAHYSWLASQTDLPFIIYNFPDLSGVKWSVDELVSLLKIPQVVGVKNTCSDLYAFERLRRADPDSVLLHGFDETLLAGLAAGANGGIGSTYNIQAARVLELAGSVKDGDVDSARRIQADMNAVIDVMVSYGVLPSLKYLLERQGIAMGPCRPPFQPLSKEARDALEAVADRFPSPGETPLARPALIRT